MKNIILILLLLISSCSGNRLNIISGNKKVIQHTEVKRASFEQDSKDIVWSRMHYYIYICLGYPAVKFYNPYVIHVENFDPFRNITIVRELNQEKFRIVISYTSEVKMKKRNSTDKSSNLVKDSDDVLRINNLLDDMIVYARTGVHKQLPVRERKLRNPKKEMEKRIKKNKDSFFFY